MKVLFLQPCGSSRIDDVRNVKSGYARYLFRYGFAKVATEQEILLAEQRKAERAQKYAQMKREAQDALMAFDGIALSFQEKANEEGHLFGSVNESMIIEALAEKGKTVEKSMVKMSEHIKNVGEHTVQVEIFEGVIAHIPVSVTAL